MPIYEYLCQQCNRKMSFLVLSSSASLHPTCKFCKSRDLEQMFSRFATPKSEERRLESLSEPSSLAGLDENDPGSVARWMKKMGKEMGEDFGADVDQIAEEAARDAGGGGPAGDDTETAGSSDEF